MKTIYRFKNNQWEAGEKNLKKTQIGPAIWSDLQGYLSPCGTGWVEGRRSRREDLKRNGCREVGPSELK